MSNYSAFNLAIQVEGMRNAQKSYFRLISIARNTKTASAFEEAEKVKNISKQLEVSVDDTVKEIMTRQPGELTPEELLTVHIQAARYKLADIGVVCSRDHIQSIEDSLNKALDILIGKEVTNGL